MASSPPLASRLLAPVLHLLGRSRLPRLDGALSLAGLQAPVEILRDEWGIPHIYAANESDLWFAQGFVHAQERLFQMDFNRRLVAGRLSEVIGAESLPVDRWMRILTMRRVAEFEVSLLSEAVRNALQAYANGINAFLAQGRLPLEFSLLRYRPEPWVPADSLAWVKMMAWSLSVNWEMEILRSRLVAALGAELAAELEPPHLGRWPYVIPPGVDFSQIGQSALERAQAAQPFSGPSPYAGLGSNNWVLSGRLTASGAPLLANDMHLGLTTPAIWFENHLEAGDLRLTGVAMPGIPAIIAGHNGHVAWGFTNGFPDVQDLYIERLRRAPGGGVEAEYNGKWEAVQTLHETIRVRRGQPVVQEVTITRHGPVINALAPDFTGEQPLALRWTALDPDTMIEGIFSLSQARTCADFHQALRAWQTPTQNVVYADTQGSIGYTFAGKIPLRSKGDGRLPVPGWTDEYEWSGYVPFEALPHVENPPQGYIATANNRAFGDYPLRIELEPISGDRAQRIAELILDSTCRAGRELIDPAWVQAMHFDLLSPSARIVARVLAQLPLSVSVHTPETDLHEAVRLFREWDGTLAADSPAAAIYQAFIRRLASMILTYRLENPAGPAAKDRPAAKNLPAAKDRPAAKNPPAAKDPPATTDLPARVMGKGPVPLLSDIGLFGERWLPWITEILADPNSHWFNLGHGEKRDETLRLALQAAIAELKTQLGPEIRRWRWGQLHQLTFNHPLGSHPLLGPIFNNGPYPMGGDHTTVWATGASYHDLDSSASIGPPYRMIVDLSNLPGSLGLLAPGQSGHLASPHYNDQAPAWFTQGYHPLLFNRQDVAQAARHTLTLTPH